MLLARLLSKIYKKKGIILVDYRGQKYICGKPNLQKPLTLKLLKKNLNQDLIPVSNSNPFLIILMLKDFVN